MALRDRPSVSASISIDATIVYESLLVLIEPETVDDVAGSVDQPNLLEVSSELSLAEEGRQVFV